VSLINEALRKARQEEGKKERKVRGIVPSTLLGRRTRSGSGLAVTVMVVLAAAVGGAAATWWLLGGRTGATVARREASTPALTAATAAPSPTPAPTNEAENPVTQRVAGAPAPAFPRHELGAGVPQPTASVASHAPEQQAAVAPAPGSPQESAPAGPHERVYVLDAHVGNVKLHLDYIVYRPSAPFPASTTSR
jgi:hypothetical protein